jgi:hypothetical protein
VFSSESEIHVRVLDPQFPVFILSVKNPDLSLVFNFRNPIWIISSASLEDSRMAQSQLQNKPLS